MNAPVENLHAVAVRPAAESDIPAITGIYAQAVLHGLASFELEPPDEAEMLARMRRLLRGGFPYVVAELNARIVGYAYAGPYRDRPAYAGTLEDAVYVAPDTHRLGAGRALLGAVIAQAEQRGYRQMIAVIGDSANAGSIRLHRALGSAFAGTLYAVGYKHGRWLDSVLMQRALGQADKSPPGVA